MDSMERSGDRITYLDKKAETELRFRLICKKYISDMI
jgi:hypothetical protein